MTLTSNEYNISNERYKIYHWKPGVPDTIKITLDIKKIRKQDETRLLNIRNG